MILKITYLFVWATLLLIPIQSFVAAAAHRKQSQYTPGKLNPTLGHESFVFRSHRTLQNSLEHIPVFTLGVLLSVSINAHELLLLILVAVFFVARALHMVLYYAVSTATNPSPRSYPFLIGFLCEVILFGSIPFALFGMM